jgi:hypothetical protein
MDQGVVVVSEVVLVVSEGLMLGMVDPHQGMVWTVQVVVVGVVMVEQMTVTVI